MALIGADGKPLNTNAMKKMFPGTIQFGGPTGPKIILHADGSVSGDLIEARDMIADLPADPSAFLSMFAVLKAINDSIAKQLVNEQDDAGWDDVVASIEDENAGHG